MCTMASQITGVWNVYSAICSGVYQRKHQSWTSLAFVMGIHRWPVDSPHKGPVNGKLFDLMTSSWCVGKKSVLPTHVFDGGATPVYSINKLKPRQNCLHFADDIFKCIFLNENVWISLTISLKFVPRVPINNIPALVRIMAWCRPGDKPLSEPMMVSILTHKFITRPQWVNTTDINDAEKSDSDILYDVAKCSAIIWRYITSEILGECTCQWLHICARRLSVMLAVISTLWYK